MKTTRRQAFQSGQRVVFETKVSSLNNSFQSIMEVRLTNRINPRLRRFIRHGRNTVKLSQTNKIQGESDIVPLKRIAQWLTTKLFGYMARLDASPHHLNRTHDGQEWLKQSHSLPTSQSGQE